MEALPTVAAFAGRRAASLAVLGDSTAVGLGDPLPAGGWRGFGPLLAAALGTAGEVRYTNLAVTGARMGCLRHRQLPGAYDTTAWSVDRLHPSERGHRMLALGYTELLGGAGIAVPRPVDLDCSGGRQITAAHHVRWLIMKGLPWLGRRGADLLPHAAALVLRDLLGRPSAVGSRSVDQRRPLR